MSGLSVGAGAISVAHAIHYAILAIGLLGLVALLAPRAPRHDATGGLGAHDLRVAALRRSIAAGTLGAGTDTAVIDRPEVPARTRPPRELWLPIAVVSMTAAASVHAAVGPAHFREQTLFGVFFAAAALAQLSWSIVVTVRTTSAMLAAGAAANVGLVVLWLVSRTTGIPGLLERPEAVGAWDLACVAWELVAAASCLRALAQQSASPARGLGPWTRWDRRALLWAGLSVVGLGLLSIAGAGA